VARLRECGAVFLGSTTTPEFGWKGVTDSPLTGITRNPWDTTKTPGGSSGGSSAAAAAGYAPLTLGTDGGGSIRIPAGFSGIFGHKPSFGRVPAYPLSPFGTVAHVGPMTRTVEDACLMMNVIAQPDARDWTSLPPDGVDYTARLASGIKGLRIAFSPALGYVDVDPEIAKLVKDAVRVLEELGADVTLVLPNPPLHTPTIVVAWSCEMAQGKKSIIVDTKTKDGMEVFRRLVAKSDVVSGNFLDDQLSRLGIDPIQLPVLNRSAILMQSTAMSGERGGPRANQRGYDPSAQSTVGITMRFGGPDAPTYNGVASAVDYLCGYIGAFATATALYARAVRGGQGDHASTSLVAAGELTELLFQKGEPPASAVGQNATGPTPGQRWYRVKDGHIFARAPRDVSAEIAGKTKVEAIADLKRQGIEAVPVQSVKEIADIHKKRPTTTMNWQRTEKDGWWSEMFAPTWFVFDNQPFGRSRPASRMGADAREVLTGLGYSPAEIDRLVKIGAIGRTEWVSA
jgi:crotonobetainyl-CoA:carnitine CoA-transferase CaiB-like acyl-CoA transferase